MIRICPPARLGRSLAVFLLAGFAATGWAQGMVTGTATYRERIALPPDAVLEVTLEDVSRADAPAEVLGRARVERAGQVPIRFEIPFDPAKIQENHGYSVRARITAGGRLLFTTDRTNPVITRGHPSQVNLMLRKATRRDADAVPALDASTVAPDAPLVNTYWKLMELRGQPVAAFENQREAHIVLRAGELQRVGGAGGCNRLMGGYRVEGDTIAFDGLATTMMACPQGMDTEQEFLRALREVKTWKVGGQQLELRDGSGAVVARLEARYMR